MSIVHGAHVILFSADAEADRAFFRDVLGFRTVDAGHGWLIFGLPPAEAAFHPADPASAGRGAAANEGAALYLMCEDLKAAMESLQERGVACTAVTKERWGQVTGIVLPSGRTLGLYEPRHPTATASPQKP